MTELLVGTKKGLFVLRGDPEDRDRFALVTRAFAGDVVEFAIKDPRTGRYFASVTSGFYGPRLMFTDDPTGEWRQAAGPAFPEGSRDLARAHLGRQAGRGRRRALRRRRPGRAVREQGRRRDLVAERGAVEGARGRRLEPGGRRARPALHLPVAGRPQPAGDRRERRRRVDHGGRRPDVADRLPGARAPVHAGGGARDDQRPLRAQHASRAHATGAPLPAVPRERLPQRRRGRHAGTTSRRACRAGSASRS